MKNKENLVFEIMMSVVCIITSTIHFLKGEIIPGMEFIFVSIYCIANVFQAISQSKDNESE